MNFWLKLKDKKWEYKNKIQRFKKGYADIDCYNLHYWLTEDFPKMIKQLRDNLIGCPIDNEFKEFYEFPLEWLVPRLKELEQLREKQDMEYDIYDGFDKWYIILTRIIYCLEQASEESTEIKNEYEKELNIQVWGEDFYLKEKEHFSFKEWWNKYCKVIDYDKNGKPKLYKLELNEPDPEIKKKYFDREKEISSYREKMKNEAFNLLSKYFWDLFD